MLNTCIYCVIGVECNSYNIPTKITILNSFLDVNDALEYRKKIRQYTIVDIVETSINNSIENQENTLFLV
jgi:hypothetical protein